jgi:hypothetical protein
LILYSRAVWEVSGCPFFVALDVYRRGNTLFFQHLNVDMSPEDGVCVCVLEDAETREEVAVLWESVEPGIYPGSLELLEGSHAVYPDQKRQSFT